MKTILATAFLIVLFAATGLHAETFYVDNSAPCTTGSTCDGKSWATAWKDFPAIKWGTGTGLVGAGDTLYISGGSTSKTYSGTLTVGASGTSESARVTIDVGANSPAPSGHDGLVIIDGAGATHCIYIRTRSYVTVNGLSGSALKLQTQNSSGHEGSVRVDDGSYVNIDYIKVNNANSSGVRMDGATYSRIRGCDIRTGNVSNNTQTDGIYLQFGHDNIIEDNTVVLGNNGTSGHNDCLQVNNNERNTVIRGNWFSYTPGRGNGDSQALIVRGITGAVTMYVYNNVIIGSSLQCNQSAMFCGNGYGTAKGAWYIWNNIIVAQCPNGVALRLYLTETNTVASLKNNIMYSPNGWAILADSGVTVPSSVITNNLIYSGKSGNAYSGLTLGSGNITGVNPTSFWNPNDGYRTTSSSAPWIDKGTGTGISSYFTTDRDGNARPSGSGWDIGTYEYGGSEKSSLSPPVNFRIK